MAYDKKYRTRVVEYIHEGHTQAEASALFNVGTTSIKRWLGSYNASGSTGGGYKVSTRRTRKIDPDKLDIYMNENPDAFLWEIASAFSCSIPSVHEALRRNKYTLKKRRNASRNVTKKRGRHLSRK